MIVKILSLIICTFNRSGLLKKCLDSLLPQITEELEIVIIDNNSPDDTALVLKEYIKKHKIIRYVSELEIGLSHARNRGIKEAKADWILYIDDDAIAFPDFVTRALYLVNQGEFECVGGMYYGYFDKERPKWVTPQYGTKDKYADILTLCPYYIPHGGVVLYKKSAVINAGCFNQNFGMQSNKIAYAEEMELQYKMEKMNCRIAFDPNLKIYHLVNSHKLTLSWQLNSFFALGRDSGKIEPYGIAELLKCFLLFNKSLAALFIKRVPLNSIKLLIKKKYYWENFLLDSLYANLFSAGLLYSKIITLIHSIK